MALQLYLGTVAIDGAMTAGSHTLTSAVAGAAVGDYCDVLGAGPSGSTLVAVITAKIGSTITLGYAASVTVTDATVTVWKPYAVGRYSLSGEVSSLTNQPSISFSADRMRNATAPVVGQPVLVLDLDLVPTKPSANQAGDIFGGSIASVDITQIAGNANATYDCQCVSWESIAARRGTGQPNDISGNPANGKFSGLAAGGVFQWVADLLVSDISAVSVVTGPTINEIVFDYTDIASAFDSICEAASDGTNTYIWRMDCRRNLFFEIQSTNLAPWNISNSDALNGCTYSHSLEKFANSATVTPQNSSGDTIDSTLVRTYNNTTSIDERSSVEGGTGYHEIIVAQGSANSSMSADTLAESIAKTYGQVPATVAYSTYRGGLRAGHLQTIVLTSLGVSGTFLIDSVNMSMSNGKPLWEIHAVDGALIGDWRTALADLASGRRFSSISGGASNEFYTDAIVAGHISPDLANGFNHQVYLVSGTPVTVDNPIFTGGTIASGQDFTLRVYQDATGSRPDPTFDTDYSGTSGTAISTEALSISTYYFRHNGTDFALIGFAPGAGSTGGTFTPPDQPTAVFGAEYGTRSLEQPLARTKLTIRTTCTLAPGNTADSAKAWLSKDAGASYVYVTEVPFNPSVPVVDFPEYAPPSAGTWRTKILLGSVGAYPSLSDAVESSNFTVAAIAAPGTSLASSTVTIPSGAGGTFPYDVVRANGTHYWSIPSVSFDDTPALADPSSFFLRWTAEDYDAAGTSVRGEEAFAGEQVSVAGAVKVYGPLTGEYGTAPNRTGNICKVRLRLYICSHVQQTGEAWLNTAAATLQKTVDITVAVGGAIPVDLVNMTAADPTTWGSGVYQDAGQRPRIAPSIPNVIRNPSFEEEVPAVNTFGVAISQWTLGGTNVVYVSTQSESTGGHSIAFGGTGDGYATQYGPSNPLAVRGGEQFYMAMRVETVASNGRLDYIILPHSADGAGMYSDAVTVSRSSGTVGWTTLSQSFTVPVGAAFLEIQLVTTGKTTGDYYVDWITLERQTPTGSGTEPDGNGGVRAALADGLTIVSGKIAPNLGGGIHINPSTHLLEPDNLAIGAFGSSIRPVALFSSDPALPDATNYPVGTYGFNVTTKIFKRVNNAGTAWVLAVDGGKDIQAGTITATQIDATSLNAAVASFGYVAASYLTANYVTATAIAASYATFSYLSANYVSASTIAATYATISALAAKTITAGNITTGTCTASVSFTAPTITVSGSGWTINLDATSGFKVTNGSTADVLQMVSTSLLLSDSGSAFSAALNLRRAPGGFNYGEFTLSGSGTQSNDLRLRPLTQTTVGAAGGASALPATPLGYFYWNLNGANVRVPYYN